MFIPHCSRHARSPRERGAAFVVAAVAALLAAGLRTNHHLPFSKPWVAMTILGIAVAAVLVRLFHRLNAPDSGEDSSMSQTSADATANERQQWLIILLVIIAALLAVGIFLALTPKAAASQEQVAAPVAVPQSAYVLTRGGDTIVVERVTRSRSSISGDLLMKGQGRMTFTADLAAGPFVPSFAFKAWGTGASPDTPPLQSGVQTMTADSAFITVQLGGAERRLARAIKNKPLPLLNNDFAMFELAVQRARAQGARAMVPMFALSAGTQLEVMIEFLGKDSVVVRVAGQETRFGIDANDQITGGVLPSQNIVITRVDGAAADKISIGRPDYGAPAGAPYTAEEVTVKSPAGHVLTGTLTLPKGATRKLPAVITITGSGQQDRDEYIPLVPNYRLFRQVADTLGRRGIAVLRLDDRGINGSGGDLRKATSADFADDIRAGIAFLRARPEIDGARIALAGHSEGGIIAPMVASTDPRLKGVVLLAGTAYTGRHISEVQNDTAIAQAPGLSATQRDSLRRIVPGALDSLERDTGWIGFYLKYNPLPTAKKVRVPVLILQGTTDQQVTPEQASILEAAFKTGGNTDVTRVMFNDRNHLFLRDPVGAFSGYSKLPSGAVDGEVLGTLADWLAARLKP
jgi:dienelactone hydrolase